MKKFLAVSLLCAAIFSPIAAHAATADLRLIGTITPAACVPNFTGGGTIDYGNIPAGSLNVATQTMLPAKSTVLNVTCNAPATFYLSTTDERAATAITTLNTITGAGPTQKNGLGASGGTNIGAWTLQITTVTPDTGTSSRVRSLDNGVTWGVSGGVVTADGSYLVGFTDGTGSVPAPHTSVDVGMNIVAALDKSENLPITGDITIDGLATIEVTYP